VARKVEDMIYTFFWSDPWLGEIPLCEMFGRLLDLAVAKSSTVAEMHSLEGVGSSMASLAGSVVNEDKLGYTWRSLSKFGSLCDRLRWG
jgi:hypothetical protein